MHARMQQFVDEGKHAGILTLVARNGKVVDVHAAGLRDREQQLPMTRDTIFRIYSMSKIVTSVAALILVEEGRLRLDDPVGVYLPAFTKPMVLTGGTAAAPVLEPARIPITVRHLFTHSSGFIYGFGNDTLDTIYKDAKLMGAATMAEFLERAAKVPLEAQPGERFLYGINTDLLGAIVEQVSGQTLDAFVQARITGPLHLRDTSFVVPAGTRSRLAKVYAKGKDGALADAAGPGVPYPDAEGRGFHSGGGGMFSTLDDYARFGQMLLNGGHLDGVRILGRKTVESMQANHLAHFARPTTDARSSGFGLGGAVRLDLASGGALGTVGQFGWSGAASTYFNIDPRERTMIMVFAQHFPHNEHDLFGVFSTMVYAALVDQPPAH